MVVYTQIGLHEDVLTLDFDNEYANLIVNRNSSYETVGGEQGKDYLLQWVERFLKRRLYFKKQECVERTTSRQHTICMVRAAS